MYTKLCQRLAFLCWVALAACSGDDDEPAAADAGAHDHERDAGDASASDGGGKGTGSGKEGAECKSHADCASSLSCLKADEKDEDLKVCARSCKEDNECEAGERCLSVTREPSEAMCWNTEEEALSLCGPAHTAFCDETKNLGCLRVEDDNGSIAAGVCLSPCELGKDDACADGFECLDILGGEGLCVRTVSRGDVCDEPKGEFCQAGNLCLSDRSEWRCYQDCSESSSCDDDKECKALQGDQGAYCE